MNPITGLICMLGGLPGFLSQTIHVRQTPVIWATKGDSITLPCDYTIIGENASIGSYKWYRHTVRSGPEVSENNKNFSGRLSRVNLDQFIHGRSVAITLHPVELADSGMYYCEVSFQIGRQISGEGNGTFLNVTETPLKLGFGPPLYTIMNIIRLVLGVLLILAGFSVCCSSRDKGDGSHHLKSEEKPNMASPQPNAPPPEENVAICIDNIQPTEL